ncbi:MFS transporter [Salinibacterium sp. SYSU T00001]|nr:MFS transporter [Salinibacterium sedimenticola]MCW4384927.1 MFS transporter [Salinibacterium sedimenticola]
MTHLSPARKRLALLSLALGGFGIGATEFVAMGLLPNLAADLLPELYAASPEEGIGQAGWLISAYALGVVVGAPTIAASTAHLPRKKLLLWLLAAFTLGTIASALLPSFGLVLAARFAAGLPHGAYFGIASIVAADIMGPGNRGKGVALVLSGLTIANVVGVPAITWLGQVAGWRVAYLGVAVIFAATFVAVLATVPMQPGDAAASFRGQVSAFRRPQLWLTIALAAIGFGGFFAIYSYIAPVVTEVAGRSELLVPWVLAGIGVGMTVGNVLGGWLTDLDVRLTLFAGFAVLIAALLGFALTAQSIVGAAAFSALVGLAAAAISPAVQTRLMDVAGNATSLAAALNHSALNIGNSVGAAVGGATIAAGLGYLSPAWAGLLLGLAGVAIAALSFGLERRLRR